MTLPIEVTLCDGAVLPSYQTDGSAGMDLRCIEPVELKPLERKLIRTGLKLAIPKGYEGQVRPRSGLALKHGVTMLNSPGTIDSDYRGEVGLIAINLGQETVRFEPGERLAQLVICAVVQAEIMEQKELCETGRGEGGFGSTGSH